MKKPKSIRFSTLASKYGPVILATSMTDKDWELAVKENRFATVYHDESDWTQPIEGMVGHHGFVNTMCKIAFAKPLPPEVHIIGGMRTDWDVANFLNSATGHTQVGYAGNEYVFLP